MRLLGTTIAAALFLNACPAYAGPCSAKVAELAQQIGATPQDSFEGPTAPQSVGAQLGRQPTPATVDSADHEANTLVRAALNHIREADEAGNAAACQEAIAQFKDLYGLQ